MDAQMEDDSIQYSILYRGQVMKPISEAEIRALVERNGIKWLEIQEVGDLDLLFSYVLCVHTKARGGPYRLTSMRKKTRQWRDLNKLIGTIRGFNVPDVKITVTLLSNQTTEE
ncbi:MAG: hypothetical protein ACYCZR_01595 [Burkholderiales bacterium]